MIINNRPLICLDLIVGTVDCVWLIGHKRWRSVIWLTVLTLSVSWIRVEQINRYLARHANGRSCLIRFLIIPMRRVDEVVSCIICGLSFVLKYTRVRFLNVHLTLIHPSIILLTAFMLKKLACIIDDMLEVVREKLPHTSELTYITVFESFVSRTWCYFIVQVYDFVCSGLRAVNTKTAIHINWIDIEYTIRSIMPSVCCFVLLFEIHFPIVPNGHWIRSHLNFFILF